MKLIFVNPLIIENYLLVIYHLQSIFPFSFFRFVSQLDGMFTFLEINKKVFEDIVGSNLLTVKLFKKIPLKHLQQM